MTQNILKLLFVFLFAFGLVSCTKEVPPELLNNKQKEQTNNGQPEMPDDSIHRNLKPKDSFHGGSTTGGENEGDLDEDALKYTKEADEADSKYQKSKSEEDKKACIFAQLKAANFLMFEADLPPREKYKPALQRYRRVLELDPKNQEAMANKTEIEDIYKSMGKPIPN
jgi:tetratricopeptide (TPR) repeat protein